MSEKHFIGNILLETDEEQGLARDEFSGMRRPGSAPPSAMDKIPNTPESIDPNDPRLDPAYFHYYYSQRPIDPRLPPPLLSWRQANVLQFNQRGNPEQEYAEDNNGLNHLQESWGDIMGAKNQKFRTSLVERIQEDFPRTPSPVFANSGSRFAQFLQQDDSAQQAQHSPMFYPASSNTEQMIQQMQNMSLSDQQDIRRLSALQEMQQQHAMQQQASMKQELAEQQLLHQQQLMAEIQQQADMFPPSNYPLGFYPVTAGGYFPPHVMQAQFDGRKFYFNPQQQVMREDYYMPGWENQQMLNPMLARDHLLHRQRVISPHELVQEQRQSRRKNTPSTPNSASMSGDSTSAPRSKLMEEFRNAKSRKFELEDIIGHVVEFSRDQHGSRFIQQKLESASDAQKDLVFREVYVEALDLMTDVFGNYVIQKLFEHGLPMHQKNLAQVLRGHVLGLTLQTYGCRVIQKALDVIDEEEQAIIAQELEGHVMRCVQDQNGNHVIQKCIEKISPNLISFVVDSFAGNISTLAVHSYGCRVIQRILEYCAEAQTSPNNGIQKPILDEIVTCIKDLVEDQYGNYVVQHVLENGHPRYRTAIINQIKGKILQYSQHKFASNVVEKCFQFGARKERQEIIEEMMGKRDANSPLYQMMKDQYANYVVQKMIDLADEQQRKLLVEAIKPHIPTLRRYTYGKHIIARIEKMNGGKSL